MTRVVVVRRNGQQPLVIAMSAVRDARKIKSDGLIISWKEGQASALHTRKIAAGREVGTILVSNSKSGAPVAYDVTFAFVAHAFHPKAPIRKK